MNGICSTRRHMWDLIESTKGWSKMLSSSGFKPPIKDYRKCPREVCISSVLSTYIIPWDADGWLVASLAKLGKRNRWKKAAISFEE